MASSVASSRTVLGQTHAPMPRSQLSRGVVASGIGAVPLENEITHPDANAGASFWARFTALIVQVAIPSAIHAIWPPVTQIPASVFFSALRSEEGQMFRDQ